MGGRGSSSGRGAKGGGSATPKILGQVKMGNSVQNVYQSIPQGWKAQNAQATPFGYIFVTNGITPFQNAKGKNKGKRKTGLIKDKYVWKQMKTDNRLKQRVRTIQK